MKTDYEKYWKDRIRIEYIHLMPRHHEIVKVITRTKSSGNVLDLGCGEGHVLKMLSDSYEKYGCDISETALQLVKRSNIRVKKYDLNDGFPFHTIRFDFIVCSEVLEHLERPFNVLENARKHLTEDGLLLLTTPNVMLWRHRITMLQKRQPNYDKNHINIWRLDEFVDMLAMYGYRILEFYPTYFDLPFLPTTLFRYDSLISVVKRLKFLYDLFGEQFLFVCKI